VRLFQLEDFTPNQLHLLHLAVYYARKQVSMISSIIRSRLAEHKRRRRAQQHQVHLNLVRACALLHSTSRPHQDGPMVYLRSCSCWFDLPAWVSNSARTCSRSSARRVPGTGPGGPMPRCALYMTAAVLVAMVRVVLQVGGIPGVVGGLRSRLRCDQPCRGGCRTANALAAAGGLIDE
jgi:hypothetical protein